MSVIALHEVTAGYGGVAGVHDVSLSVGAGELVALLGANGAGKTTTVGAACGLAQALGGSIELLGADVTSLPPRRRAQLGLATVPDDRGVFSQLTVAENLRLGGRRGESLPESLFPQLEPLLGRRAGVLSGGEQTLLALARALVRRPRAILVDELTTGLAPVLAESAMAVLRHVADEWGTGVLVAEQSVHLALAVADRAIVLQRGRVALEGAAQDISTAAGVLESAYLGEMD